MTPATGTNLSATAPDAAEVTPREVLTSFDVYQPKTARMVADEYDIGTDAATELLATLEEREKLTKARGGTETPVWLRRYDSDLDRP